MLKHAHAGHVRVQLRQRGDMLELEVTDDGNRADAPAGTGGRGIDNMHARARQLGAQLEVRRGASGTPVLLRVPSAAHSV